MTKIDKRIVQLITHESKRKLTELHDNDNEL